MKKLITLSIICLSFYQVNAQQSANLANDMEQEVKLSDNANNNNVYDTNRKSYSTIKAVSNLQLSPIPSYEGVLMIRYITPPDNTVRIRIVNTFGMQLYSNIVPSWGAQRLELDISFLSSGVYILIAESGSMFEQAKFIVQ